MALKKLDMVELLNSEIGLSKAEAKSFVDDLFETLITSLESGETLRLQQLGTFRLRDKNERIGRNPKNGETHTISARRVVYFKASSALTDNIQKLNDKAMKEQSLLSANSGLNNDDFYTPYKQAFYK